MNSHRSASTALACFILISATLFIIPTQAYEVYRDISEGACYQCHPELYDAGALHHLHTEMTGNCSLCHTSGDDFVYTWTSTDPDGEGCRGCHGVPSDTPFGWGAGLRLHHANAGAPSDMNGRFCVNCHFDDPVPWPESALPLYYMRDDVDVHDPCAVTAPPGEDWNDDGFGLDNDGDLDYDAADSDCGSQPGCWLNCPAEDGGLISDAGNGDKSPDIDGSGLVEIVDFALFASVYQSDDYCSDFDCNGWVGLPDFAIFAGHMGHGPGTPGHCD